MVAPISTAAAAFPVDWQSADVAGQTYYFDPMHFPAPISPLGASTMERAFTTGYITAAHEYSIPLQEARLIHRNHYRFWSRGKVIAGSEEESRRLQEMAQSAMESEVSRLIERWHGEHRPAITAHLRRLRSIQFDGLSARDMAALLDEVDAIHADLWTIHFRIAFPMLTPIELFDELYTDLFSEEEDADAHALLVGANSESVKAGIELSDLAASARRLGLEDVFAETPLESLLSVLEMSPAGRVFLRGLYGFLDSYGLRQDLFELTTPTWREQPSFALMNVRNYLRTGYDARAAQISMIRAAENALATAREKLAVYPQVVREQFEALLRSARAGAFLQEEHNFYIDQQGLALLRLLYLRLGQHLRELGTLEAPEDIFMLRIDELRRIVLAPEENYHVRELVEQRWREMEIAKRLEPPPFIGDAPVDSPGPDDPVGRANTKFFGGPPQESDDPGQLKGNAGSRGVVTGIARVARSLEEASDLQPREILVATTTMPAWTPLFGVAAAVVTETGGSLSHCAIVAREYGIPAVVGAYGATQRIASGQEITVDGGQGIVILG